jgi:hypothetical protein
MPLRVASLQIALALNANLDLHDNAGLTALPKGAQSAVGDRAPLWEGQGSCDLS